MRSLRKQQFCKIEMRPNSSYKRELKDPSRKPVFDVSQAPSLRKSLNCKCRMVDGSDTLCVFPERFLRAHSRLPPKQPPATNAFKLKAQKLVTTEFRREYDRGELPLYISLTGTKRQLAWKVHYGELNFFKFLPLFFEGIREKRDPLKFLARNGTRELLHYIDDRTLVECLPALMLHINAAFNTNDRDIICETLKCIQALVLIHTSIGPDIVPFYRRILPGMRKFMNRNLNLGDKFEYGQHKKLNIADLIDETLHVLEVHGGDSAFYEIKKIVPLYTSKRQILHSLSSDQLARQRSQPILRKSVQSSSANVSATLYDETMFKHEPQS